MSDSFIATIDNSWTLFLDRDGVINKRIMGGYVTCNSEFSFLPGVLESIKSFSTIFRRIIIVTNQQGVGKGIMTQLQLNSLHDFMRSEIEQSGGKIDEIFYCTDIAQAQDNCRKPSIKMANRAIECFPEIDLKKSIMVGDSLSDIQFGKNAGMITIFSSNQIENKEAEELADVTVEDLQGFKNLLKT